MARLWSWLRAFWMPFGATFGLAVVAGLLIVTPETPLAVIRFFGDYAPILLLAAALLALVTFFACRAWRRQRLAREFWLITRATNLQPEDLGFQPLRPGATPDVSLRPHYDIYIPRTAHREDAPAGATQPHTLTEADIQHHLTRGAIVLLVGSPLDGKTRTAFQMVRRLANHIILMPHKDRSLPSDAAFRFLKGKRVVVLLDNLTDFAAAPVDLMEFCAGLHRHTTNYSVLATSRDGSQLQAVRESTQPGLRRFYETATIRLRLAPLEDDEILSLATGIGVHLDPAEASMRPTPGWLTMADPLKQMLARFEDLPSIAQSTLRSMKLLDAAGVPTPTHDRVRAVLSHVFAHSHFHLPTLFASLADNAFIHRPATKDPLHPEPAYLSHCVPYTAGRTPLDDFDALAGALEELGDPDGLFYLGNTHTEAYADNTRALAAYDRAIKLKPDFPEAWNNRGVVLRCLGRLEEALAAYDRALQFRPHDPDAWNNRGVALGSLGRHEEALAAFEHALQLKPDSPEAWYNRGVVQGSLGRHEEALAAYDGAIKLKPDFPEAWNNRGVALGSLGRHEEALAAIDRALHLEPHFSEAWDSKGQALESLGRYQEALAAYDRAIQLKPDFPEVSAGKARVLAILAAAATLPTTPEQPIQLVDWLPES